MAARELWEDRAAPGDVPEKRIVLEDEFRAWRDAWERETKSGRTADPSCCVGRG